MITNWHNVTGINPNTSKQIGNHGGRPDQMGIVLLNNMKLPILEWLGVKMDLYKNGKPDWLIHPVYKEKVDVVAFELDINNDFSGRFSHINNVSFDKYKVEVADDIFVLGFPNYLNGGGYFPIWKRGSVASEPDFDLDSLPKFLIDTATREGMSGSPVIYRRTGIHGAIGGQVMNSTIIGRIQGFVGIYSGRIKGETEFEAQLGTVWKAKVIDEIITGGIFDQGDYL
ncbi:MULTISPECIES: hypothetical protein [unclassified Allomuricauda]|uniref:hypothetical protein n=1 Tax=unclassified Allomuricauda TaxID=2615049 RepID=UPI00273EB7FD|nr:MULTISPECIES: hypothetical protein [unclassified Allomuricauda]